MKIESIRVKVEHVSMSAFSEDMEILSDRGIEVEKMESENQKEYLLSLLTNRQKQYAILLFQGMSRKEIAKAIPPNGVILQAVNQIILRMRKRLLAKGIKLPNVK